MTFRKTFLSLCFFTFLQLPSFAQCSDNAETENSGDWNTESTWLNNLKPCDGASVTISEGDIVTLNQDINLQDLTIEGVLIPATTLVPATDTDLNISTNYILINGLNAKMEWGTETNPYTGKTIITLTGDDTNAIPVMMPDVYKGIMAMNGATFNLFGIEQTSWTQLAQTANISDINNNGDPFITVEGELTWDIGDSIVIASTDFAMENIDVKVIQDITINTNQTTTITFSTPLEHKHFGKIQTFSNPDGSQTWDLDERAEVGLLSHNIKIQGDQSSETDGFGGHIMIMGGSQAKLSNVELYRLGQRGILGRYPFHWHLNGDSDGQYISNCSVHKSYNRAITIHGTNNTVVSNNVAFDNLGHAYFLEDGSEIGNTLEGNLGLLTLRPTYPNALLPSDTFQHIKYSGPATFWISNPDNIVRNNHAAGSKGSGFWLFPHGLTQSTHATTEALPVAPTAWENNVAHSNYHGVLFGGQPKNQAEIDAQKPNVGNGLKTNDAVILTNHTTYKNRQGSYIRNDNAKTFMNNWKMADNVEGTVGTWESYYNDCLYVGGSENYEIYPEPYGILCPNKVWGHSVYDGPYFLEDCHFANFDQPNMATISNWGAAIRTIVSKLTNTTSDMYPPQIHFHNNPSDVPHHIGAGIYDDVNGTMTGYPNHAIVRNHPFMVDATCSQLKEGFNSEACPHRYGHVIVHTEEGNPQRFPVTILRSDGPRVHVHSSIPLSYYQYNPILKDDYSYRLLFSDHIPRALHLNSSSLLPGESTILEIPNVEKNPILVQTKNNPNNPAWNVLTEKSNLLNLKNATSTAYFFEKNTLYIKIVAPNDYNDLLTGGTLERQHFVYVCFNSNDCSTQTVHSEITLSDDFTDWEETIPNSTDYKEFKFNFSNQDWYDFKYLEVNLPANNNAFADKVEAFILDEQDGLVPIGNFELTSGIQTFHLALPYRLTDKDNISQLVFRAYQDNGNFDIESIKLLDGNEPSINNPQTTFNDINLCLLNAGNITVSIPDHLQNIGNNIVSVYDLPNGLTYDVATNEITGSLTLGNTYSFALTVNNQTGGINTQRISINLSYIPNPSFECPNLNYSNPDNNFEYGLGTGWTFSSQGSGIAKNYSLFTGNNETAPHGNQVAFLQGAAAVIETDIVIPPNTQCLSFSAAQRACNDQTIQVFLDDNLVNEITPASRNYTEYSIDVSSFAGTNSPVELSFRGFNTGDNTVFIDNLHYNNPNGSGDFSFDIQVMLEGPYDGQGNMKTLLNDDNLLPASQPYNISPYFYSGSEYVSNFADNVVDWVLVEVRTGTPSNTNTSTTTTVETKAGLLLQNGHIVSPNSITQPLLFNNLLPNTDYHIVVRHRNHLDIISQHTYQVCANQATSVNFTNSAFKAHGTDQLKPIDTGIYAMYAGDINSDGTIQNTDFNAWKANPAVLTTYHNADLHLDGSIQTFDYDVWYENRSKIGVSDITYP